MRRSEILQKFHVAVEVNDKSLILVFAHHLIQEALTGASFLAEHAPLTHACVHQQAKRQGEIGLAGEVTNGLGTTVFRECEVIFAKAVDDLSMLVTRRGKHIDHLDLDGHRGHRLVRWRLRSYGRALLRRPITCRLRGRHAHH